MKNFHSSYLRGVRGACAPLSLLQLTDKSDQEVMSTCLLHGFKTDGGMGPHDMLDAAHHLGIKAGEWLRPTPSMTLGEMISYSKNTGRTYLVALENHVLVVRAGDKEESWCSRDDQEILAASEIGGQP